MTEISPTHQIETARQDGTTHITLRGAFSLAGLTSLNHALTEAVAQGPVALDISGVTRLDTSAAWAIVTAETASTHPFTLTGTNDDTASLLATVRKAMPKPDSQSLKPKTLVDRIEDVGRAVAKAAGFATELLAYFGIFLHRLARTLRHPSEFRMTALVHHCQEVGVKAVPIVALMSFLIGVVLAFQGSTQLRQFGAEVFVVDLIAVSVLRELGILLTAIIVAGRTASAFTAAIGSMKMREEIDAMRTLGIDPATALFVPRILALLFMLPILGLIANLSGLIGGALMSWIDLGISPGMFQTRLIENTGIWHLAVGMIKAPFFALIIGVVGCHAGMQVGSNAESLGQKTSDSVVTAIFAVIVIDAVFSVFFAQVGV
ncbi:MlaE family lipid ABC transporter permease subunit [Pseudorhodobacter turbinis]|uniref:MlaE family lipid ABC transporter permease subunit n=1 Tax=Pseudorhodobacter turbinis TaxID=2500533 RepID=A0A4P8EE20_9RHOB|nr:MlaE family lipid ABC transporter permease subunit [Pseudorhodobacter turbinis]QCO55002.1 MlaE family lipid ABC transporter permease subunit [Pseudorhodobacter turbinis]